MLDFHTACPLPAPPRTRGARPIAPGTAHEITAIPASLAALVLEGCIVTLDALGCQRATARTIPD